MSDTTAGQEQPMGPRRFGNGRGRQGPGKPLAALFGSPRGRVWIPTLVVLLILAMVGWQVANFTTEWMWFSAVGYSSVLRRVILIKSVLFVVFGLVTAGVVVANFLVAYRSRPVYVTSNPSQQSLERYRIALAPYRRWIVVAVAAVMGLLVGTSAASQWELFALWNNSVDFGVRDPQFNKDLSFFVFQLPWWMFLLSAVATLVVLGLLVGLMTHYLYGGLRLQGPGQRTTAAARVHLSVLLGIFVLAKAVGYWLDRFHLAMQYSPRTLGNGEGGFTGLTYTDVHAVLGAKYALAVIALLCALLFFVNVVRRTWMLPAVGVGLLVVSTVVIGGIVPQVVQRFQVRPSEQQLERPYLQRHIEATRAAYGISNSQISPYDVQQLGAQDAANQAGAQVAGARLVDPNVVSPTFLQQQQNRGYYRFAPTLDVDRYLLEGKRQELVVGVREINPADSQQQRNWQNQHTVYTHGKGVVAAKSDVTTAKGEPEYVERDIPPVGQLGPYESRIYFGEFSPDYSIVGAPQGAAPQELDYQVDVPGQGQQQQNTTFTGQGGVPIGSLGRKLLYALKYQEQNIVLSKSVNSASQILYVRHPRDRVHKVAPWLTLDGDPYPSVINGRVLWMIDGYTTSSQYPYSLHTQLDQTTEDALVARNTIAAQPNEQINYIRNSVKATVDAYDGTVTLYAWDEQDPVLKVWRSVFPGVVKDRAAMQDVPGLLDHVRYPQDLFKVQRTLLGNYHQTDPDQFYNSSDLWHPAKDPGMGAQGVNQPPYYLSVQMPGQQQPTFSLTSTFVPRQRQNLTGFVAVNSQYGPDYGKMTVLKMNANSPVLGPEQFAQSWRANETVRKELTPLEIGQARTIIGNVLTLPAAQGLMYVMPVYVQNTTAGSAFPLMQLVGVGYGDQFGVGRTLAQALQSLSQAPVTPPGQTGTPTPPAPTGQRPTTPVPTGQPPATPAPGGPLVMSQPLRQAISDAQSAQKASEQALAKPGGPDWVLFGQEQQKLSEALNRIWDLQQAQRQAAPPATSAPTPSLSASVSPAG